MSIVAERFKCRKVTLQLATCARYVSVDALTSAEEDV